MISKFYILELRKSIVMLKEKKQISDLEILRYVHKRLGELLNL